MLRIGLNRYRAPRGQVRWRRDDHGQCRTDLSVEAGRVHIHAVTRRKSIPFRCAWPAELDLMAELAGMRLRERWAG